MKIGIVVMVLAAAASLQLASGQKLTALRTAAEQEAKREARASAEAKLEKELGNWDELPESIRELYVQMQVASAGAVRGVRALTDEERRHAQEAAADVEAMRLEKAKLKAERRAYFRHSDLRSKDGVGQSLAERQAAKRSKMRSQAASKTLELKKEQQKAEAVLKAGGFPIRGDGWFTHGFSSGLPQIYSTRNATAAETTSTDLIQPGGSLGFDLDGAGTTIGI